MRQRIGIVAEMPGRVSTVMGWVAAAILAMVTLGVFSVLHDYGPESAVRRFHAAVLKGDDGELRSVTEQPIETTSAVSLRRWVLAMHDAGANYQLLRVERHPNEVFAAVVYSRPDGESWGMVWVVEKKGATWKVDAARTNDLPRDRLMGMPPVLRR